MGERSKLARERLPAQKVIAPGSTALLWPTHNPFMACPICGEQCTCPGERGALRGSRAVLIDPESFEASEPRFAAGLDSLGARQASLYSGEEEPRWRQEVASRVDAFCARRGRKRHNRTPSLNLDFERAARATAAAHYAVPEPQFEAEPQPEPEASNVIEFPRLAATPPPALEPPPYVEELAEPILDKPRILDAEDPAGLLFGGQARPAITLEPGENTDLEADAGPVGDIAPLALRFLAGCLDGMLVATATAAFTMIFLRLAGAIPRTRFALAVALAVPVGLWAIYQYLFLVQAARTPGMRLTRLRLSTFEGQAVRRHLRRWRALAVVLSCASLGMGLIWAAIDEYGLCWHDRITRTYLRRSPNRS